MKKISTVIILITLFAISCKKVDIIPPESSKELKIVTWDSSKFGGYLNCGTAGLVDGSGLTYQLIASSEEGEVTVTNYVYHINVNDDSKPITMMSMYDGYTGVTRDILVTASEVEFSNMKGVVPEGDNGRYFGASLTYSGIGRNGVVSGRTISSVTLKSVTYVDRYGHKKTIYPNLKSPDRMSAYSYMYLQPLFYGNSQNGLHVGQNKIFEQAFNSVGGDHFLKEIPLKLKTVDCLIGTIPQISIGVYEDGNTAPIPIVPATVNRINDSIFIVKLPQELKVKTQKITIVTFYCDVQSIIMTSDTKLRTSLGDLRYLKYAEIATGTEFLLQNENFMWTRYYYSPNNIDQYYSELYP